MNSKERKELRYQRRKHKRDIKKQIKLSQYDKVDNLVSLNNLRKSAKQCTKGVKWKTSIQRYNYNYLYYITKSRLDILNGNELTRGFICFYLTERGKKRSIKAVKIEERVIQKTLCRNTLLPYLGHYLIYDNGACMKGKGTDFAIKRCTQHLVRYYKENKTNEGYVLLFDFKSYFDSIPTTTLCNMLLEEFKDEYVTSMIKQFILSFKKYGENGIGLGSEISQICAVYYLNKLDHLMKDQLSIKPYNRYMDDGYAVFRTKEEAINCKKLLFEFIKPFGVSFNEKKTQIVKLKNGFKFLKVRFILKDNGKVDKIFNSKRFVRERRKLKKFKKFVDDGIMTIDEVCSQVTSVIGSSKGYKNYHARLNIQTLFNELFKEYGRRLKINGRIGRTDDTSSTS